MAGKPNKQAAEPEAPFRREDFLRDLAKATKPLPPVPTKPARKRKPAKS